MNTARFFLPTFAALLFAGACAAGQGRGTSPKTESSVQKKRPATDGKQAPIGDAKHGYARLMESTAIDGTALAPEARPTALVVFASWCGPCRNELAALGEIREKFPTLRIIGINAYEDYGDRSDEERLRVFLGANAPWLTQIVHATPALLRDFGKVPKIPTLFVYDGAGEVVAEFRRNQRQPPSHEELEAAIASAVKRSNQN